MTQTVITISRLHGSAGEQIGRQAAENLSIPFFGKAEIMQTAAQESGIALMHFYSSALRADMGPVFPILPGAPFDPPLRDKIESAQATAIRSLARRGSCVIVGGGACKLLCGRVPLLRVLIYAPKTIRIQHLCERYAVSPKDAQKRMASVDRRRMADHSVCKRDPDLWTDSFDLCINSACFSVRQAARMIENAYRQITVPV